MLAKSAHEFGDLLDRTGAENSPNKMGALTEQLMKVECDIVTSHGGDQHDSPLLRQNWHAGGEIRSADQVEHDVEAAAAGFRLCKLFELAEDRINDASRLEPILFRAIDLVLRARSSERHFAESSRDLLGRQADSAAHDVDQHVVTIAHVRLRDERVEGGDENLGNRCGGGPVHAAGNRCEPSLFDGYIFGVSAAGCESENSITFFPVGGSWPELSDFARELQTRNVLHHTLWSRILSLTLQKVRTIESGGMNPDKHLAGPGLRSRRFLDGEYFRPAKLGDDDSFHGVSG